MKFGPPKELIMVTKMLKTISSCHPLGTPFIDIRTDFNLLPSNLDAKTSKKLISYYLSKIKKNREFHDSVEFNILFTCFNFKSDEIVNLLKKSKFTNEETNKILS